MDSEYCMLTVSVGNESEADTIASALVEEKLAACVQATPIRSTYTWEGQVQRDSETLLFIKTQRSLYPEVERRVKELHSYDVAEVLSFNVDQGNAPYLSWISESTRVKG